MKHRKLLLNVAFLLGCLASCATIGQTKLAGLVGNGSVILQSPSGKTLVDINSDHVLTPASIVKLPLAHVALATLSDKFRFETHFYVNNDKDLLIRGLGDPFLVSEEIALIAENLRKAGLTSVRQIVVDDSAFEPELNLPLEMGADDPYAARNSALAVNFNTVNLERGADGQLISGEPQTPLTMLAQKFGAGLALGEEKRVNLGADPIDGLHQVQQLFNFFLIEAGITVAGSDFRREALSAAWEPFYQHHNSRTLGENLDGLLRYSNNFIANQLFLTLGAQLEGYPVTTEVASKALRASLVSVYGEGFGSDPTLLLMSEGSGLGRSQKTSAAGMIHILNRFKPYAELLPEYNGVLRKSGTLTGVYNFVGYIRGTEGLYPFVILTNQAQNNRDAVLRLLKERI
ncbi:MAG: D-alanyl-D-alanine carboxypeptidase [Pseudohongiellaceae bacterium]